MLIGLKSFSNSKVRCYYLTVSVYIFDFSNGSSLYIVKKIFKTFEKESYYIFRKKFKNVILKVTQVNLIGYK